MRLDDIALKKTLLEGSYVSQEDIDKAEAYAKQHGSPLIEYLLVEGLTSMDIVGQALAESFGLPYANLAAHRPSREQVLMIPEPIGKKFRAVVFSRKGSEVTVATDEPEAEGLKEALAGIFPDSSVHVAFALPESVESAIAEYRQGLQTRFAEIVAQKGKAATRLVEQIVEDALSLKASDIHFEPREEGVVIRFRIDGVLHDAGEMAREQYENVVNRLKVLAKLRIDEHFGAQDGAIRFAATEFSRAVDLRVAVVPTLDGEKITVRVLSSYVRDLTLSDIGLSKALQEQIVRSAKKPFGMILVTGPTGSGKTTTLYSIVKLINTRQTNITTIEDPVEYKIQGLNQIQVNPQANLTFAKGLRSIMRHDPNTILVGEIRDLETADIAVNAALTGHLMLSTFHANNAATAVPRFIDMGVEPFLVGSTLELVIAQRLLRKICDACKESSSVSKSDLERYGKAVYDRFEGKSFIFYKGRGCDSCSNTGYRGRIGVFEHIVSFPELQDLIVKRPSTKEVDDLVRSNGFVSMFDDGIEKVKAGITTIEEVLRVVGG